jgi:hypothetical protein
MNTTRLSSLIVLVLVLSLALPVHSTVRAESAALPPGSKGGLFLYTVPPQTVCMGDTFTIEGGGFISLPCTPPANPVDNPMAGIAVLKVTVSTALGSATPNNIVEIGEDIRFSFSYTAKAAGDETIKATLNDGLAFDMLRFKVEASCTYDAFLVTVLDFTSNVGDMTVHTLTNVTGMGTMKRARSTSDILQGDGKWDLEENMLSQPPECVQWYMPPLLLSGTFELDGEINSAEDTVSVILAFQPRNGPPVYHGKGICVDADGNESEGWGYVLPGGDEAMTAKIQTDFPTGGGSQQVELTGGGMKVLQSVGNLEYTATLTIIPR